ncbi:general secretion pathway protein C [Comamonadaceae bacterium OH2545_COT-014]|nr:general secretion pathway protein C [Comamonadaceae bacterium OH2545_COT-014]
MPRLTPERLAPAAAAFALWALAAGSALFWALRGSSPAPAPAPVAGTAGLPPVDVQAVARALGAVAAAPVAAPPPPPIASRLALRGVVTQGGRGAALLALDGQPPKPYRVGAAIQDGWVVHAVAPHAVVIATEGGAQRATLEMPKPGKQAAQGDAAATAAPPPATPEPLPPRQAMPADTPLAPAFTPLAR